MTRYSVDVEGQAERDLVELLRIFRNGHQGVEVTVKKASKRTRSGLSTRRAVDNPSLAGKSAPKVRIAPLRARARVVEDLELFSDETYRAPSLPLETVPSGGMVPSGPMGRTKGTSGDKPVPALPVGVPIPNWEMQQRVKAIYDWGALHGFRKPKTPWLVFHLAKTDLPIDDLLGKLESVYQREEGRVRDYGYFRSALQEAQSEYHRHAEASPMAKALLARMAAR